MADEAYYDLRFPIAGLNTSTAYNKQPPGTTVRAVNVRAYDGSTNQLRGGSRMGITPFLGQGSTEQVSGTNYIQSLTVIVTADESAVG